MKIKKKVLATLHAGWMSGALVEVRRNRFDDSQNGFVIDISGEWLLLQIVDGNFLQSDGYAALRLCDITKTAKKTDWVARASQFLGLEPVLQPDVLLIDLPGLLSSVNAHYPVLGIEREGTSPDILYIGRIDTMRKKSVTLRELNADAQWQSRDIRHRFKDITCVTFSRTYMKLLLDFARAQEAEASSEFDNPDVI